MLRAVRGCSAGVVFAAMVPHAVLEILIYPIRDAALGHAHRHRRSRLHILHRSTAHHTITRLLVACRPRIDTRNIFQDWVYRRRRRGLHCARGRGHVSELASLLQAHSSVMQCDESRVVSVVHVCLQHNTQGQQVACPHQQEKEL
jgi:hypothetical protein